MEPRRRQTGGGVAVATSLALHALIALWLWHTEPRRPPPAASQPVELDVRWLEPAQAPAPPSQPAPAQAAKKPKQKPEPGRLETASSAAPSKPSGAASSDAPTVAAGGDVPVARGTLVPSAGLVFKLPAAEGGDEQPHGTTVHNDPSELPDAVAVRDYTGEVLTRKLNDEVRQDLARAMQGAGTVKPYFRQLETALRDGAKKERITTTPRAAGDVARDVLKTLVPGAVLLDPEKGPALARQMTDTALGRAVATNSVPLTNVDDQRFREGALQMMATQAAVMETVRGAKLRTVLDITFDATGAIADASIAERSGDPQFDESVLHMTRKVTRALPERDEKGLGTSWWHSKWQFTWEPPDVRVKLLEAWPVSSPAH